MKKSFITLIEEELENTADTTDTENNADIKDPVFTFEVIGKFDLHTLEQLLKNNKPALAKDGIYITIKTNGIVDDEQYIELANHLKDTLPLRDGSP